MHPRSSEPLTQEAIARRLVDLADLAIVQAEAEPDSYGDYDRVDARLMTALFCYRDASQALERAEIARQAREGSAKAVKTEVPIRVE